MADLNTGAMPQDDSSTDAQSAEATPEAPQDFDSWLTSQDDGTKSLIKGRFTTLEKTLDSERTQRKSFEKDLKKLTRGMDENNPLKPQLEKLQSEAAEQNTRADFYEEAHKRGISNLRLAYHAAKFENLIDDRGRVDWDSLKEQVPEVFAAPKPAPRANAGAGTGQGANHNAPGGMNFLIRRAAGKV